MAVAFAAFVIGLLLAALLAALSPSALTFRGKVIDSTRAIFSPGKTPPATPKPRGW